MTMSTLEPKPETNPSANVPVHVEMTAGNTPSPSLGLPAKASTASRLRRLLLRHFPLALFLIALAFALVGNQLIFGPSGLVSSSTEDLAKGGPWMGLAFVAWLLGELVSHRLELRAGWGSLDRSGKRRRLLRLLPMAFWIRALSLLLGSMSAERALPFLAESFCWGVAGASFWLLNELVHWRSRGRAVPLSTPILSRANIRPQFSWSALVRRAIWLVLAIMSSVAVWENTGGNRIEPPYIALWFASAILWSLFFAPLGWNVFEWTAQTIDRVRRWSLRKYGWIIVAFVLIILLGASFRFANLDTAPREMMNSDHSVDIRAAYGITQGEYVIMVPHWHYQEAMHVYFIALLGGLPGRGIDFYSVKLLSAIESLAALPLVFWAGYELLGRKNRGFALAMALMMMGLVAVSYWHNVTTRYSQRTHLTLVFAALTVVFLARAMRENRRSDYIMLGLTLGYGMYAYTSCRMLPLVAVVGIGITLALRQIGWRGRLRYAVNLTIAGFIAFMVYLPVFHVSLDDPVRFYTNSTGPIFGVSPGEPIDFELDQFVTGLMHNYRRTLLMFNWNGDANWLQSASLQPALDLLTGALLVLGMAAWLARLLRSPRDPLLWLVPAMIIIMLLPTALAVAHPETVPGNTRVLGAMPGIYLLVSLAVLRIAQELGPVLPRRLGTASAIAFSAFVLLVSNADNTTMVFDVYAKNTIQAPYSHIGRTLRALIDTDLTWGNILFVPYSSYWAVHNIYIEAGNPGLHYYVLLEHLPDHLTRARSLDGDKRLDPQRDVVFIYPLAHGQASEQLREWFPEGREVAVNSYFEDGHRLQTYMLYRVSAPDIQAYLQ